jgi:AcrR family transcriptional regulator
VPTGIALRDVREQLFDAAERILLRDGPNALTSRVVTAEAGVAKGVLHRHFADFDDFLFELVADRADRIGARLAGLVDSAGTGTVAGNVTEAVTELFGSVAVSIISLLVARDELRARVRASRSTGLPILSDARASIAAYLRAEQRLGRVAPDADVETLAGMVLGSGHLLFADRGAAPPTPGAVLRIVTVALAGITP